PRLHSAEIDSGPQVPRCKCGTELVEKPMLAPPSFTIAAVTLFAVQTGPSCDSFAAIQEIELRFASRSGEYQRTIFRLRLQTLERVHQLRGNRNLALLVRLGCPVTIRLVRDFHHSISELDVLPVHVHGFLLAQPRHQEELEPQ